MKYVFYSFWLVLSLAGGGLALAFTVADTSVGSILALALVVFYSFCFYRLIRSAYPAEALLENPDIGFWICWLLTPLSILLIKNGLETIVTDTYTPARHPARLLNQLMLALAEHVGPWLPGTIVLLIGLLIFAFCSRGIMRALKLRRIRATHNWK